MRHGRQAAGSPEDHPRNHRREPVRAREGAGLRRLPGLGTCWPTASEPAWSAPPGGASGAAAAGRRPATPERPRSAFSARCYGTRKTDAEGDGSHAQHEPGHRRRCRATAIPHRLARQRPRPPRRLTPRIHRSSAYGLEQLRSDLARFAFLLGGNDGEHLLSPGLSRERIARVTNPEEFRTCRPGTTCA